MLWSAFILGLIGSTHCVAMCGPIVLALPLTKAEKREVIWQSSLYHLGRVSMYGMMGFCFGLLGWGIALAGYQKIFSLAVGIVLLLSAIIQLMVRQQTFSFPKLEQYWYQLSRQLSKFLSRTGRFSVFGLGLLGGLLPCGLVYLALVGAIGVGTAREGALYMLSFGLGTTPLLLAIMIFGKLAKARLFHWRRLIPYACFLFGLLLIYRSLQLRIPVELSFWESGNFPILCH